MSIRTLFDPKAPVSQMIRVFFALEKLLQYRPVCVIMNNNNYTRRIMSKQKGCPDDRAALFVSEHPCADVPVGLLGAFVAAVNIAERILYSVVIVFVGSLIV